MTGIASGRCVFTGRGLHGKRQLPRLLPAQRSVLPACGKQKPTPRSAVHPPAEKISYLFASAIRLRFSSRMRSSTTLTALRMRALGMRTASVAHG